MKLNKIFAISLAALAMTACSDDSTEYNTATDVTVSMERTTMEVRENSSVFNVPISVEGTSNGTIIVTVETTPTGSEPAKADENYLVTSNRIIIPADATSAAVEILPVDNTEENDTRTFNVTIVSVEGAKIGPNATTTVGLRDNDSDPYEKLTGNWVFTATDYFDNVTVQYPVVIETPDPDDPEQEAYFGHELYAWGLEGYDFVCLPFRNFSYNELTGEGTMDIAFGDAAADGRLNFGGGIGAADIIAVYFNGAGSLSTDGSVTVTFTKPFDTITFPTGNYGFGLGIVPVSTGAFTGQLFGLYQNMKLERAK